MGEAGMVSKKKEAEGLGYLGQKKLRISRSQGTAKKHLSWRHDPKWGVFG